MKYLLKKVSAVILAVVMIAGIVANTDLDCVKADTVLTSPDISVVGYQIKTNESDGQGISFRTICNAPDVGSVITVDGKNYTVTNLGTIYVKDPNGCGDSKYDVLEKSYTELCPIPYPQEAVKGYGFKYIGQKEYNNRVVTFGYIATDVGIMEKKDGYTSYVRTMTKMNDSVSNSLHVRAFVEAVDEEGNNVIIYGQYQSIISVAKIAYDTYMRGDAPNKEGHDYLYDNILHKLPTYNAFYKDKTEDYGWSGVI